MLGQFLIYNSVVLVSALKRRRKQQTVTRPQECFGQPVLRQKIGSLRKRIYWESRSQGLFSREELGNEVDLLVGDREFKERVKNICIQRPLGKCTLNRVSVI